MLLLFLQLKPNHMKTRIFILVSIYIFFLITSCQKQSVKVEPILKKVEILVEHHPDSALVLLEEIPNPQSLKKSLFYRYSLLQIQAKDKSYKDITTDTLIFDIQKYYDNRNEIEKAALASFYCGRVRQEQKKYEEAMKIYLNAEKYLMQSNNVNLKGLYQSSVAAIYYQQLLMQKAINHFKLAKTYFHQSENYKNEISVSNFIGNCLLIQEKADSALAYYYKALALADKHKLRYEQARTREGLGVAYREIEEWKRSEFFFKEAWIFSDDSLKKARLSSNIAFLFENRNNTDSTVYYLQRAITYMPSQKDNFLMANIYKTWSVIEEKDQNFQEALSKYKLYNKYLATILDENKNSAMLEIEGKYNFQLIETRNKQLIIGRQKILLFSLGLVLTLLVLIFLVLRRSAWKERKLEEAELKIYQMKEMARGFNEKENSFRNVLIRHFDILKKAALLEGYLKEEEKIRGKNLLKKFNEIVYGQKKLDWDLFYQTLNDLNNDCFDRLKNKFPQLDESEFRICCLIYVEFNNTEIAIILSYSV
ncbi:tetratricopeptide repeat protein, partial [Maribellus maritimus]|uniref:tetratricopeptide repeat protein n=1 Tax=Maribellus maritimus TaxID=2870838 RepID=UPI001EECDBE5